MSATQFFHINLYGQAARKGQAPWANINGIVREGARAPGATGHVPRPIEPTLLHGTSPLVVGALAMERAAQARDIQGRRLRCDGAVLLAAVASYPVARELVQERGQEHEADLYHDWRETVLIWLRRTYGETLESVVEHTDEPFLHLHAYCVPILGADCRLQLASIHPGRRAREEAEAAGLSKAEQNAAYRTAMRRLQDEFHEAVSRRHGHARLGPRRRRLDREAYKLHQAAQIREADRQLTFEAERVALRDSILEETATRFTRPLAEAQAELHALAEARRRDAARLAALSAENEALKALLRENEAEAERDFAP